MVDVRRQFGDIGEELAADTLKKKGYKILARQYRCQYGEIDLVCQFKNEIVFVEVKSRHDSIFGYPEDSVTQTKRRHLAACAEAYLDAHHLTQVPWRVDVVAIEFDYHPPKISHFEDIDMETRF